MKKVVKIRNIKANIEISSPYICKGTYNEEDVFFDEESKKVFFPRDGWEEVEELSISQLERDVFWHDLRDDLTDIPKDSNSVVICRYRGSSTTIITVGSFISDRWYDELQHKFLTDVIAWRELPEFQL